MQTQLPLITLLSALDLILSDLRVPSKLYKRLTCWARELQKKVRCHSNAWRTHGSGYFSLENQVLHVLCISLLMCSWFTPRCSIWFCLRGPPCCWQYYVLISDLWAHCQHLHKKRPSKEKSYFRKIMYLFHILKEAWLYICFYLVPFQCHKEQFSHTLSMIFL